MQNGMYTVSGFVIIDGNCVKATVRSYFSKKRVISTPGLITMISKERF